MLSVFALLFHLHRSASRSVRLLGTLRSSALVLFSVVEMGPRKRKRQSVGAKQTTEKTNGDEASSHNDGHTSDAATETEPQLRNDAAEVQLDLAAEEHQSRQMKLEDSETAQPDEQQPQREQQDGQDAESENNGEDEDESEHNDDADEDGDEQQPEAEADQPTEDTGGRTRPMRAVRQKAEEEAAEKKRRRKNRKRRRDGTYMASDEEEEEEAEPKQRRPRRSNAAQHEDSDGEREAQKAVQWVQCELCNKWRKAPANIDTSSLPDQWHCALNTWDAAHASCDAAEEVQQDEETIWPGLPRHFLNSREREDFYFSITRPPFDSAHAPAYPTIQGQPIDLYMLYAYVMLHTPYQTTLDYWAPLAEQLELRPTEKCWKLLRRAYRRHVKAKVVSEREMEADDKEDEAEGPSLIGANESEAKKKRVYWTEEEDAHLKEAIERYGIGRWTFIAANVKELGRHSSQEIRNRWRGYTRNRKVKLRVVSDEKLREMEESEGGPSAKSVDGTALQVAGKRPYPADVVEMDEHMRYSALGRKHRVAAVSEKDDEEKQPAAAIAAVVVEKPAEGVADTEKPAESAEAPVQQFYHKHRHVSIRLSPLVTLPLPVLRRYLCDVVHMKADNVLQLLKDMWDEGDEDERRRLLSEAVHAQLVADSKRSAMIGEMNQYCTQTLRKDRRVRWATQMAAYQQSLQAAAASTAAAESAVVAEAISEDVACSLSPDLASGSVPATVAPLQLATPVRKRYKLPAAALASPATAATPVDSEPPSAAVTTATIPVRPRTYTIPSVSLKIAPATAAAAESATDPSALSVSALSPVRVAVDVTAATDVRSPAALAARIRRPPPLPPNVSSPSSSTASGNSITSPPTSASNRRSRDQRGPYFTSRKRVALSSARDAMMALIRSGTITPMAGYAVSVDDRDEWTEYDKAIAEAVAPGNVEDFTPAGVKLSAILRLVDDKVLEDQKKRNERRHHVHSARGRETGSDEQHARAEECDGEEEEGEHQSSLPTSKRAVSTEALEQEQKMDTTE